MCCLFEARLTDAEIFAVAKDAPFAGKFARRGDLAKEIDRDRTRWEDKEKERIDGNERFSRMVEKAKKTGKVVQLKTKSQLSPDEEPLDEDDVGAGQKPGRKSKEEKEAEAAERKKADEAALDEAEANAEANGIPGLPRGFQHANDFSVQYWVPGTEKQPGGWAALCSPIKFAGAYRDPDNGSWGHLVEVRDPDHIWHPVTISHAQAATVNRPF